MNTEENNNNNLSNRGSSFWETMVSFWHKNRDFGQPESVWKKKANLVNGTVPANQLPSYVDDVIETDAFQNLPVTGEKGKIYIVTSDNTQYRWSGSGYIEINSESDITNHLKNYWRINNDSGYKGINTDKPFAILNNSAAQNLLSGGVLASNAYSDSQFIPPYGIHAKGFIQSDEGFQNRYYKIGQRNRIWSFANADAWGLSYYQGSGLSQFLGEGIGFHFGDAADYKVYIHESGKLYTKDNIIIDGNIAWHAGNLNPDNYIKNGGTGTAGNPVWLGWTNSNLQLQVDNQVIGNIWHSDNLTNPLKLDIENSSKIISGTDLNSLQETGFFRGNALGNSPTNNPEWFFITSEYHYNGWCSQTATSYGAGVTQAGRTFKRNLVGGNTWTDWSEVFTQSNFNPNNKVNSVNSTYGLEWDGLQTYLRRNANLEGYLYHSGNFNPDNYATLNTPQTFIAPKDFAQTATVTFLGNEANYTQSFNISNGLYTIVAGFIHKFYGTQWKVGNKRGGAANSLGYSFEFSGDDGANYSEQLRITTDGNLLTATFGSANEWKEAHSWGNHAGAGYAMQSWVDSNFVNSVENAIELGFEYAVNSGRPYVRHSDGTVVFLERDLPVSGAWTNHKALSDRKVLGEMAWKNYGNGHTIFDISSGNTPWGVSKSNVDAEVPWSPTYPTLVGGNGSNTYGVRVDSARVADKVNGYELSDFVRMDVPQTISSRKIMNGGTGNSYTDAALEIQGNGSTVIPGISFHQPGVVASQIRMDSNGQICIVDNPGGNFENFRAKTITGQNFNSVEHGTSYQWNQAYNWGNHSAQGYATQSWVQSQNYTSTDSVNEIIERITEEHTNPEYAVTPHRKITVIIITDEFRNEFLNIGELIRERKIEVINTSSREILVNCEVGIVDSIRPRETTEYYISSNHNLIKKGSYRDVSILT